MKNTFQRCAARIVLIIPFAAFLYSPSVALAVPILNSAQNFAVLGGAGVAINGTGSVITGSVGSCCGSAAVTGSGFTDSDGTVYYSAGSVTNTAHNDLLAATSALNGLGPGTTETSLDNITLGPGVYTSSDTNFTGTLTLNGEGNANALWVFLFPSSLTTASSSNVIVENAGAGAGVYWVVGSSADLGSNSVFAGNILANTAAANTGTNITDCGRLLTETASVTLAGNDAIGIGNCSGNLANSSGLSGGGTLVNGTFVAAAYVSNGQVPEPGTVPLLCGGFLALTLFGWQSRKRVA
jgi:hypothetical protein